jgi:hypothetical protein
LTEPARPGSAAPSSLSLALGRNPNPIRLWRLASPTRPSPSSGEIRRRSLALLHRPVALHLLTAGFRRHHLPSPTSPPSSASVDLALVARSAPVSLLELLPVLGGAGGGLLGSASVGRPPQPRRRRRAVLGHEHIAASSPVQLLEGGLVATTMDVPPPWSFVVLLCEHTSESSPPPPSFCACSWWPGQRARHVCLCYAMLLLLCSLLCYDAIAALLELVL